jgi:chromosome segregation ATPase
VIFITCTHFCINENSYFTSFFLNCESPENLTGGEHDKFPETTIDPDILPPSRPILSEHRNLKHLESMMVRTGVLVENAKLELVAMQQQRQEFLKVQKEARPILDKLHSKLKTYDRLQREHQQEKNQLKEIDKKLQKLDSDIKSSTKALQEIDKKHQEEVQKLLEQFDKKSVSEFHHGSKFKYDKLLEETKNQRAVHENRLKRAESEKKALELKSKLLKGSITTTRIQLYEKFSDIKSVERYYQELTTDIKKLDKNTENQVIAAEMLVKSAVSIDTDLKKSNKALYALTGKYVDVKKVEREVEKKLKEQAKIQAIKKAKSMSNNLSSSVSQQSSTGIVISKDKSNEKQNTAHRY